MNDKGEAVALQKVPSGIEGFDDIPSGGFPSERTTLLLGGPGSGKTVLALQASVGAALRHDAPGIFVAFEENAGRIRWRETARRPSPPRNGRQPTNEF